MRAVEQLFVADLRHRWFEYLLAATVIALVTGALVLQRSVTQSANDRVHDLAHRLGKNMLVVPAAADLADIHLLRYDGAGMPDEYRERIRRSSLGQHIRMAQARLNANVEVNNVPAVLVGEGDGDGAGHANGAHVELGWEVAEQLGVRPGDELRIQNTLLRVTGVRTLPPEGLGMGVFTSLATAQRILNRPGEINSMRLGGCWCRLDVPALAADVEKLLPGTRAITVAGVLKAQKGTVETMNRYAAVLYTLGVLLVGGTVIALVASQVRRSRREIGLLLAVGARPATLGTLIIGKAALVGALGGGLGYLAGIPLTTRIGSDLLQLPLAPPADLWLPALALSTVASMVAAWIPAFRAGRVDPTQVLREE